MKRVSGVFAQKSVDRLFTILAILGIIVRLLVVLSAGNRLASRLGGGGDTHAYLALADSFYSGQGLSYWGQPSAFRPPAYPILLAAAHFMIGERYIFAIRLLQLLAGIATAWVGSRAAVAIWGHKAGKKCFALLLLFPTLLYFTGEILTETLAAFLASAFLYFVVRAKEGRASDLVGMGVVSGLAPLLRFNMIFFSLVAVWRVFSTRAGTSRRKGLLIVTIVPFAILLPWVIRNLVVFHGQVIYSTHTGMDLVEGLLRPQGRADIAQGLVIVREAGWSMQGLEKNEPTRLLYPSEPVLNSMAMHAALRLWRNAGSKGVVVIVRKLGYFWLSTDQVFDTEQISLRVRMIRVLGVGVYWLFIGAAIVGMRRLHRTDPGLTRTFLFYLIVATGLHLLFAMNTRLRVPLVDPLICLVVSFPGVLKLSRKDGKDKMSRAGEAGESPHEINLNDRSTNLAG